MGLAGKVLLTLALIGGALYYARASKAAKLGGRAKPRNVEDYESCAECGAWKPQRAPCPSCNKAPPAP